MCDSLQQITPEEAVSEYLDSLVDYNDSTIRNHDNRLSHFKQWCEVSGIASMSEVTRRHLYKYRSRRAEEVKKITLVNEMATLRQFLDFCGDIRAVSGGVAEGLEPINRDDEDEVDETTLSAERAAAIRSYLHDNAFATFPHVIFEIFWHTGIRLRTIRALDMEDFHANRKQDPSLDDLLSGAGTPEIECYLEIVDRPETDTDLKNDAKSEREISLLPDVAEVIDGWIKLHHPMVKDDHGRMPLIGTRYGRASKSAIRENMYRLTRPSEYANACPNNRDLSCAGRNSKEASKCPFSVSPHQIRKGSITYHRNSGWPPEAVSDRADVSREVLKLHYDMGSETEKRKRRKKFLDRL